jgi:hypothetical protein
MQADYNEIRINHLRTCQLSFLPVFLGHLRVALFI